MKRRNFLKISALQMTASLPFLLEPRRPYARASTAEVKTPFSLGLASYTFREYKLDDVILMTRRLGLEKICVKSFHLPLESDEVEIRAIAQKIRAAGLDLYGGGVIYMKSEEEVERAFAYARAAGLRVIIGVPDPKLLGLANEKVQEFNIQLAIHNHGPDDSIYPTPQSIYEKIQDLDHRVGICLDAGHTQRSSINPAQAAEACADRLLDVHIKDVSAASSAGEPIEIGRGVIDIPAFVRALLRLDYSGVVSLEYEKDPEDALAGAAESIGYIRGVLAAL